MWQSHKESRDVLDQAPHKLQTNLMDMILTLQNEGSKVSQRFTGEVINSDLFKALKGPGQWENL